MYVNIHGTGWLIIERAVHQICPKHTADAMGGKH